MSLRDILEDKNAINILKVLFDKEVVKKDKLTVNLTHLKKEISLFADVEQSLQILQKESLIYLDKSKNGFNLSITDNGSFINRI